MGSPSELSLDCKPNSCSMTDTLKLEEYLARLEEERLKIDAFKRELPLCMQLLNNAMEVYKQQLDRYHVNGESGPVLEEFIPLKRVTTEGLDKMQNSSEKISWMTSAQLWSQADNEDTKQQTAKIKDIDNEFEINTKIGLDNNNNTKQRNAGAFLPFSKEMSPKFIPPLRVIPDLALGSIEKVMEENTISETENGKKENCTKGNSVVSPTSEVGKGTSVETPPVCFNTPSTATTIQTQRKARRCWSPDLHRRFVNALQMLGGSQVATPKQIRELMKVDGLTNDEVKSHLQKYRLHTRRPSPSQQAAAAAPQLVVLGGIWVPPEYATAAAHGAGTAMYGGAPHGSAHYYSSPVPQDFYPSSPHQLHHHQRNHGYRTAPQRHSSPESDVRPAGERSESIEDEGKSESSSWKGESGEKIRSLRDEGEESNGSEITLKF